MRVKEKRFYLFIVCSGVSMVVLYTYMQVTNNAKRERSLSYVNNKAIEAHMAPKSDVTTVPKSHDTHKYIPHKIHNDNIHKHKPHNIHKHKPPKTHNNQKQITPKTHNIDKQKTYKIHNIHTHNVPSKTQNIHKHIPENNNLQAYTTANSISTSKKINFDKVNTAEKKINISQKDTDRKKNAQPQKTTRNLRREQKIEKNTKSPDQVDKTLTPSDFKPPLYYLLNDNDVKYYKREPVLDYPEKKPTVDELFPLWRKIRERQRITAFADLEKITLRFPKPEMTTHSDDNALWPDIANPWDDRIIAQLSYKPKIKPTTIKTIYSAIFASDRPRGVTGFGRKTFLDWECNVDMCTITADATKAQNADLLFLTDQYMHDNIYDVVTSRRRHGQIWAYLSGESGRNAKDPYYRQPFNWTVTSSPWATLPRPDGKLFQKVPGVTTTKQMRNWAQGRTGKVAWMISDCTSHNNRLIYGKKLAEYISVDIYGQCGTAVPGCTKWNHWTSQCSRDLLQKYKFYLAFENTDCESYVTDKFFRNALRMRRWRFEISW